MRKGDEIAGNSDEAPTHSPGVTLAAVPVAV
jgi:hypothetical protein